MFCLFGVCGESTELLGEPYAHLSAATVAPCIVGDKLQADILYRHLSVIVEKYRLGVNRYLVDTSEDAALLDSGSGIAVNQDLPY